MQSEVNEYPTIIQGGMGAGVSSWRLARAVSSLGELGVVSGTALDQIFARRLQDGDPGGNMRHALDHFVFPKMAERVWDSYYIPGGKPEGTPYQTLPMQAKNPPREFTERCIVANFVEVFLARQGHNHMLGSTIWKRCKYRICHPSTVPCLRVSVSCLWVLASR